MVFLKYDRKNCVGCPPEMGCLGSGCPELYETVMRCDKCGEEVDELYRMDGEDYCENCLSNCYTLITSFNCSQYIDD